MESRTTEKESLQVRRISLPQPETRIIHVCCCDCKRRQSSVTTRSHGSDVMADVRSPRKRSSVDSKQRSAMYSFECCATRWFQSLFGCSRANAPDNDDDYDVASRRKSSSAESAVETYKRPSVGTQGGAVDDVCSETSPFLCKTSNDCASELSCNGAVVLTSKVIDVHPNNNTRFDAEIARSLTSQRDDLDTADRSSDGVGAIRIMHRRCSPIPLITLDRHTQTKAKTVTWQCPALN